MALRAQEARRNAAELTPEGLRQLQLDMGETEEAAKLAEARFRLRQMEQGLGDE